MISREDIDYLKEFFVTHQQCQNVHENLEAKLNVSNTTLAIVETRLNQIAWLLSAVVSGVIAVLVKLFIIG